MMVRFMVHIGFGQNVDCHGDGIILWETNQKVEARSNDGNYDFRKRR